MTKDRNKTIEELFFAALEQPPDAREAFLDKACAEDAPLREEVQALLNARDQAFDFPEKPAWAMMAEAATGDEGDIESLPDAESDLPYERLNEFRLVKRLGEGGMGVVYLAVQEPLGRQVAVKVIRPEKMGSVEAQTRFSRESKAVSKLRHPNIVTVFGSGKDKGVHYFAMEFIPGTGLDELLRRVSGKDETIPFSEALTWTRDVARALDCGHNQGIIHRDVKPANIRITPEGHAMLMDFGVAMYTNLSTMTLTGEFRGTPHYASPEQVKATRDAIDARSDIYSLGVTLYQLVTGQVPFNGETTQQVFHQILEKDPVPPRRLNPNISRNLETVITTAMEKEPERRYSDMETFAGDLKRLLSGEAIMARPAGLIRKTIKKVRKYHFLATACTVIAALSLVLVILGSKISTQKQEELRLAKDKFKPVHEVLLLKRAHHVPWFWCEQADPGNPASPLMKALFQIDSGSVEQAVTQLEECIARCKMRVDPQMEMEANYLQGISRLAMAKKFNADSPEKIELLKQAESDFKAAGNFDPIQKESLIWHMADQTALASGNALSQIRINAEHYLVYLTLGMYTFSNLFVGGKREAFDNSISAFEKCLKAKPDQVAAWTYLGRTCYFYARFFDFMEMADRAEYCLQKALAQAGKNPSSMLYNTLGAVALLRGQNDKALEYNEMALEAAVEIGAGYTHNIKSGIGKVHARQKRFEEALRYYSLALEEFPTDPSVRIALAELHMNEGHLDQALEQVLDLTELGKEIRASKITDELHPAVFLTRARIHLLRNELDVAKMCFTDLFTRAIYSPRDFCLAIMLISTFPEGHVQVMDGQTSKLADLAGKIHYEVSNKENLHDRKPPVFLSASGARQYLFGEYEEAIRYLDEALAERKQRWPKDIRNYHWIEDARDLYLKAMVFAREASTSSNNSGLERKARACLEEAESYYLANEPPIESFDIIERFRAEARSLLGEADG